MYTLTGTLNTNTNQFSLTLTSIKNYFGCPKYAILFYVIDFQDKHISPSYVWLQRCLGNSKCCGNVGVVKDEGLIGFKRVLGGNQIEQCSGKSNASYSEDFNIQSF